jgi:hypothetical protein
MHRNIARAYDYLKREHDRIRAAHVKTLAQNDRSLERQLFRADLDSLRHHDEMLLYEERLFRPPFASEGREGRLCNWHIFFASRVRTVD